MGSHWMCGHLANGNKRIALEIRMEFELDSKVAFEVVGPWPHTFYP